jgi:hypothetical protein
VKEGFKAGSRKVIGLDGLFFSLNEQLKVVYNLTYMARDASNQMYPMAWVIV